MLSGDNVTVPKCLSCWIAAVKAAICAVAIASPRDAIRAGLGLVTENRKEQGLFLYRDADSGLHLQVPLISSGKTLTSDALPFPHCPGVFDWPNNVYLPIMLPELTFGEHVTIPAFYGKNCVTGLGLRNSFYFRYEQPELISTKEEFVKNLGSVKVQWTFSMG